MAAVFLDRDGVLNEDRGDYVKSWEQFRWLPRALDALVALAQLGVPIVVVTNQSMVGRGLVPPTVLDDVHAKMLHVVRQYGGRIDAVLCCRHAPEDACACRKPRPGLLHAAAASHGIDLSSSVLVGDAVTDYQAAVAADTRYVHVCSGRGQSHLPDVVRYDPAVCVVPDLLAAVPVCAALIAPIQSQSLQMAGSRV